MNFFNKMSFGTLAAITLVASSSCIRINSSTLTGMDKGDPVSKTISIGDFDEIEVATGIEVIYSQTANPGTAKVETFSNLEKMLVVKCEGKTLEVYFDNNGENSINNVGHTVVTVSSPALCDVEVSSAGRLTVNGDLKCDSNISVDASSAGSVELNGVVSPSLEVSCSSAASVSIESAKCATIDAEANSASSINLKGIDCDRLIAEASSVAKITLAGVCRSFSEDYNSMGKVKHSDLTIQK